MFDEDEAAGVDETGAGYGVEATGVALTTGVGSATFGAGVAATVSFLGSAAGVAGVAPGVADGSISTKDAPTATVSPSFAWYFVITPLYFARISTVTLSVSIRAMISSALTDAPTFLTKDSTTPSLMESPIVGTC